jgi:hypothetical protein
MNNASSCGRRVLKADGSFGPCGQPKRDRHTDPPFEFCSLMHADYGWENHAIDNLDSQRQEGTELVPRAYGETQ